MMSAQTNTGMVPTPKYNSFNGLPAWAKNAITRYCSDDGETWVSKPIPALNGETFLAVINAEDGEAKARAYLNKVIGKFFPGESL
jgi:hypothetical protein